MGELSGKVALVTGTAHGIGTAIANGLEEDGAKVHRVDRDRADLSDPKQVTDLIARLGRIDVLVNNAGGVVGQVGKPLEQVSDDDWRSIVDANLTSAFLCTRAVIPAMKAARAGSIVNISSGAGRSVSLTGIQAYASAKAAQIGFTRQLGEDAGPRARAARDHGQLDRPGLRALEPDVDRAVGELRRRRAAPPARRNRDAAARGARGHRERRAVLRLCEGLLDHRTGAVDRWRALTFLIARSSPSSGPTPRGLRAGDGRGRTRSESGSPRRPSRTRRTPCRSRAAA